MYIRLMADLFLKQSQEIQFDNLLKTHTFMQNEDVSYLKDSRFWLVILFTAILLSTMILTAAR